VGCTRGEEEVIITLLFVALLSKSRIQVFGFLCIENVSQDVIKHIAHVTVHRYVLVNTLC
jgi:hypothetical protein